MNLTCEMQNEAWELLALGSLEEEAAEPLRAHLRSGCADCSRSYAEALALGLTMGASVAPEEPGEHVRTRLAQYTRATAKLVALPAGKKRNVWLPTAGWWAAAAALACAVWMGWENQGLRRELNAPKAVVVSPSPKPELETDGSGAVLREQIARLELQLRQAESKLNSLPSAIIPEAPKREDPNPVLNLEAQIRQAADEKNRLQTLAGEKERQVAELNQKLRSAEAERVTLAQRLSTLEAEPKRNGDTAALEARLSETQRAIDRQRVLLDEYRSAFRALEAGGVKQVELAGVDAAAGAGQVRAFYSPRGGLLVFARNLPLLPANKCYQLWILRKGSPAIVSGGLIPLDPSGAGFLTAKPSAALEGVTGFALTDEPAGGSVSARGKKLLFGAI